MRTGSWFCNSPIVLQCRQKTKFVRNWVGCKGRKRGRRGGAFVGTRL